MDGHYLKETQHTIVMRIKWNDYLLNTSPSFAGCAEIAGQPGVNLTL